MTTKPKARTTRSKKTPEELDYDEVARMWAALHPYHANDAGPYTKTDRARDFISVFGTEAGRRVLSQINEICMSAPNRGHADKPGLLAFEEGKRWVIARIGSFMAMPRTVETKTTGLNNNG